MSRVPLIIFLLVGALSAGAARADDEAAWLETLDIYQRRCDIRPGSVQVAGARPAWDQLVEAGQTAAELRVLADYIPANCPQLTLAAAMDRAEYRVAIQAPPTVDAPEAPPTVDVPEAPPTVAEEEPRWVGKPPRFVDPAVYERRGSTESGARITSRSLGYRGLPARLHDLRDFAVVLSVIAVVPLVTGLLFAAAAQADPRNVDLKAVAYPFSALPYLGIPALISGIIVENNRDPASFKPPRGTKGQFSLLFSPTGCALRF